MMLTQERVLELFKESGALLEGHFKLTSGKHSDRYLEKFSVLQHPESTSELCAEFARRFADDDIQLVVGPATGGILLAFETARQMGVRSLFTEREEGRMQFRRGFSFEPGERILIVEDIVTTGGSVVEVIEAVEAWEGTIVGIGLLADRSGGKVEFGYRTEPLMRLDIEAWQPEDCPLCKRDVPFTERGSRRL
jgi:orotate phosphoribosyltransferase